MAPDRALIGVLGGMGPAATLDFMTKLRSATPATCDEDHVPLLVHCVPQIPARVPAILSGSDAPLAALLAGARLLERAGARAIAMPCNTAHHWHRPLSDGLGVPLLHIAEAVRESLAAQDRPIGRVALMATLGTRRARLYDGMIEAMGGVLLIPDERTQAVIDRTILAVKTGALASARAAAAEAAALLRDEQGADQLLLACTELPMAFEGGADAEYCIDATLALAQACVRLSLGLKLEGTTS